MRVRLQQVAFLCSIFFYTSASAQDKLYFKSGSILEVKILEISTAEIIYKKATNIDGPSYHEFKSAISKIEYSNGSVENYSDASIPSSTISSSSNSAFAEQTKATFSFKKNCFSYNLTDAFFKRITIGYERLFAKGFLSIKIPISFGLGSNQVIDVDYLNSYQDNSSSGNQYYNYNSPPNDELRYTSILRKNTFGLEVNAYPFGQRPVSFFIGPAFYYGLLTIKYEETNYYLVPNTNQYYNYFSSTITKKESNSTSYAGMINTGFVFNSNSDFCMSLQIGLGFRQNITAFDDYTATIVSPSFHIGYRF